MSHPYDRLLPDLILDAIAATGLMPDGHLLALNSYENRVFQIGVEDSSPVIVKFYRPGRWPDAGIAEEHAYADLLAEQEIPVVAPWTGRDGQTLFHHEGFRYAVFPRRGGRAPEPGDLDQLEWIGRFLGRIHLARQHQCFEHRPTIDVATLGTPARDGVLHSPLLPAELRENYADISGQLLDKVELTLRQTAFTLIPLHGDCHQGNILWTEAGPHFVDLDDCANGPAIQDLWMLLNGERGERLLQLDALLSGYQTFMDFEPRQLDLIEPLRALRMIHYSGWIARRWDDPAFPAFFPWAASAHYWEQHIHDLRQQLTVLNEPPLGLPG